MLNKIEITNIKWDSGDADLRPIIVIDPLTLLEQLTVDQIWDLIYEYLSVEYDDVVNFDWEWI